MDFRINELPYFRVLHYFFICYNLTNHVHIQYGLLKLYIVVRTQYAIAVSFRAVESFPKRFLSPISSKNINLHYLNYILPVQLHNKADAISTPHPLSLSLPIPPWLIASPRPVLSIVKNAPLQAKIILHPYGGRFGDKRQSFIRMILCHLPVAAVLGQFR